MQQTTSVQPSPQPAPPTRTQSFLMTAAYVLEHNLRRLLIVAIVLGFALFLYGVRGIFEGLLNLLGQAPTLLGSTVVMQK